MDFKKIICIFSIIILFSSVIAVSASSSQQTIHDIQSILENNNESDMTGCCSVVLQLEGNDSMMSFRRDAESYADIYIEKINWHGKEAIKQYKTSGGYFCQVIITSDGWVIGYGGIDDGIGNEKIENITAGMITDNNTIPESGLEQIQEIKAAYKLGHVVMKAPNGNYGVATATNHFTGKLEPYDYISVPNRYTYFRSGDVLPNATDKIKTMNNIALSDAFGLTRRDITTFVFTCENNTNVTDVYLSNDDGSYWGMETGGLADNVNFTGKVTEAGDIPIAPNYTHIGNVTFDNAKVIGSNFNIKTLMVYVAIIAVVAAVCCISYYTVKKLRKK